MRVKTVECLDFDDPRSNSNVPAKLPSDYHDRVPSYGDAYRDTFTRGCAYLSSFGMFDPSDTIIIATNVGNIEALELFKESCDQKDGSVPSAVHFASATTSTAATSLNIMKEVRGGNLTINAAGRSLECGLLAAGLFLRNTPDSSAHLFFSVRKGAKLFPDNLGKLIYLKIVPDKDFSFATRKLGVGSHYVTAPGHEFYDEQEFLQFCKNPDSERVGYLRSDHMKKIAYGRREMMSEEYSTFY